MSGIQVIFLGAASASVVLLVASALHARRRWQLLTASAVPLWVTGLLSLLSVGWLIVALGIACAAVGLRRWLQRAGA